jgi:hypothetical protein
MIPDAITHSAHPAELKSGESGQKHLSGYSPPAGAHAAQEQLHGIADAPALSVEVVAAPVEQP